MLYEGRWMRVPHFSVLHEAAAGRVRQDSILRSISNRPLAGETACPTSWPEAIEPRRAPTVRQRPVACLSSIGRSPLLAADIRLAAFPPEPAIPLSRALYRRPIWRVLRAAPQRSPTLADRRGTIAYAC